MEKVMEMYNKSKLQFINVVALVIGLFAVLFLSFASVSADFLDISYSFKYSEMSDWDWIVDILLIAALAGNGYILYMMNMGKKNDKQSMMVTLLSALAGGVAVLFAIFDVILKDLDGVSLDFGFFVYMAAAIVVLGMNGYYAFMNKDMAMNVMNGMQSDMKKKMDSQMAKSESMDSDKSMGGDSK